MPELPEPCERQLQLPFITPWPTSLLVTSQQQTTITTTPPDNDHDFPFTITWLTTATATTTTIPFFTTTYDNPFLPFHHKSPSITSQPTTTSLHHPTTYLFPFSVSSHDTFLCQCNKRRVSPKSRFTQQSHNDMSHLADVAATHPCSSTMTSRPP